MADATINKFTELIKKAVERISEVWEEGEGEIVIKITDEGSKKARISGGKVERI